MAGGATLQTIADALGVSRATVSNAYNHPERMGAELRERILATARELGYPGPDPAARRLRHGRAGAVGLLFTEALSYAFSDAAAVAFLEGLARRCEERQAPLLLLPVSAAAEDAGAAVREAVVVPTLIPDGREGMVSDERLRAAAYHVDRERIAGFREAFEGAGVDFDEVPVYECPNQREAGARALSVLLEREPGPSVLLCTTDELALGALEGARDLGLTVPDDVSVTGFDDIPEAAGANPPLTTVHQPLTEKGAVAGDLLLELLDDGDGREVILPAEPVLRGSTFRPAAPR